MNFSKWYMEIQENINFPDPKKYYLAVVLTSDSQNYLKSLAESAYVGEMGGKTIPLDWTYKCHHTTVKFNCTLPDFQNLQNFFKEIIKVEVRSIGWDTNCIAAVVNTNPHVPSDTISHITIAHSNMVKTDYSNAMLIKPEKYVNAHMELEGVFLAVLKYDQKKYWPIFNKFQLAAPSLVN